MSRRWSEAPPAPVRIDVVAVVMFLLIVVGLVGLAWTDSSCRDNAGSDRAALVECDRLSR